VVGRSTKTERLSARAKKSAQTRQATKARQVRDPEATKAQILSAAEEEFARHGLNGARTEAIAARTGVTKAMIYYYFGSKEGLYRAVLQSPVAELKNRVDKISFDDLSPIEAMEALTRAAIAHEASHPFQQMILFQEASQNQGKYFKEAGWQFFFDIAFKILERGVADGSFRQVDPWFTALQIAGVCNFYFTTYDNMKHLVPNWDRHDPDMLKRHTEEAVKFILAGLRRTEE
jgi:TetR/AcrR family transcriptional regulator